MSIKPPIVLRKKRLFFDTCTMAYDYKTVLAEIDNTRTNKQKVAIRYVTEKGKVMERLVRKASKAIVEEVKRQRKSRRPGYPNDRRWASTIYRGEYMLLIDATLRKGKNHSKNELKRFHILGIIGFSPDGVIENIKPVYR